MEAATQMRDSHRMFLQSFMSRGVMNTGEVKASYIQSKKRFSEQFMEDNIMAQIPDFVRTINMAISSFNLEIRKGIQEHDGSSVYCLVNTVESAISRLSSTYTQNELELFKKVVEYIVESDDGKIGSRIALNLTENLGKRMGMEEAQNLFNRFEQENWIIKGGDGKISLSARTMLELDQFLQDVYPALIKKCNLCNKICLQSEKCSSCEVKLHYKCSQNLFSKQPEKRCPSCRELWS